MNNSEKIKQLEEEIQKLKKEQAMLAALPEDKELAEALHKKLCRWNHTDGCSWFYESWEKPGYSRNEWLEKAREVLKVTDSETALKVASIL